MQSCGPAIPPCARHLLSEEPPSPSECRPRGTLFNLSRGLSCEPGMVDHAADLLLFMLATRSAPEGPHYGTSEDDLLRMLASGGEKVNRGLRIHAARNRTRGAARGKS